MDFELVVKLRLRNNSRAASRVLSRSQSFPVSSSVATLLESSEVFARQLYDLNRITLTLLG